MADIITILKAKLSSKENMPEWYYRRLEKCVGCEFNTGNIDKLSTIDRLRTAHNFGKDACIKCTCGVEDKASVETERCADNPPRWVEIPIQAPNTLNITNNSPNVALLSFNKKEVNYLINYGVIKKGDNTKVDLFVNTGGNKLDNLSIRSSCGCTTAIPVRISTGYILKVEYDNKRIGQIGNKSIRMSYKDKGKALMTIIKLIGTINK